MTKRQAARRARARRSDGTAEVTQARAGASAGVLLPGLPVTVSRAAEFCLERKARGGMVLDLRGISNATDYFLIVSGESDTHVRAIAEHVVEGLEREGLRPAGVEGMTGGRWVLIDCIDAVIHVFHPAARDYYALERLWGDATTTSLKDPAEEL